MANSDPSTHTCFPVWGMAAVLWTAMPVWVALATVTDFNAPNALNGNSGPYRIYVPSAVDVPRIKGVIFVYPGDGEDYRYQANNTILQEAARSLGFALVAVGNGSQFRRSNETTLRTSLDALLTEAAAVTGRAELLNAPIISTGFSSGAFSSTEYACDIPERTIATVSHRGGNYVYQSWPYYLGTNNPQATSNVHILFIPGQNDSNSLTKATTNAKNYAGYRWLESDQGHAAYAMDWGTSHEAYSNQGIAMGWSWIAESIALRYPQNALPSTVAGNLIQLHDVPIEEGWLAERQYVDGVYDSTFNYANINIASYNDYAGDKADASWLPNETVARVYRAFNAYDNVARSTSPKQGPLSIVGDAAPTDTTAQMVVWNTGSTINIQVEPSTFDDVRPIVQMEYYDGDQLLGIQTAPGSDGSWKLPHTLSSRGIHSLTVVATDSLGNQSSAFRTVVASPSYQTGVHQYRFEVSPGLVTDHYDTLNLTKYASSGSGPQQVTLGHSGAGSHFIRQFGFDQGQNESAVQFIAANGEHLKVADSSQLPTGSTAFTVEAMVNLQSPGAGTTYRSIAAHGASSSNDMAWRLIVSGDGDIQGGRELVFQTTSNGLASDSGSLKTMRSGVQLEVGVDYYVAMAFDPMDASSTGATFYIQDLTHGGSLQKIQLPHMAGIIWDSAQSLTFGYNWDGLLDEVRMTNRLLSESELMIPEPTSMGCGLLLAAGAMVRRSRRR